MRRVAAVFMHTPTLAVYQIKHEDLGKVGQVAQPDQFDDGSVAVSADLTSCSVQGVVVVLALAAKASAINSFVTRHLKGKPYDSGGVHNMIFIYGDHI